MPSDNGVTFRFDGADFERELKQGIAAGLDAAADTLVAKIKGGFRKNRDDPVDPPGGLPRVVTGSLFRGIGWGAGKDASSRAVGIEQGSPAMKYASVHEFGAVITPKSKPFLMFIVNGKRRGDPAAQWRRSKRVVIPARPFMRPARDKHQKAVSDAFVAGLNARMSRSSPGGDR
jgi:hypothetical protein